MDENSSSFSFLSDQNDVNSGYLACIVPDNCLRPPPPPPPPMESENENRFADAVNQGNGEVYCCDEVNFDGFWGEQKSCGDELSAIFNNGTTSSRGEEDGCIFYPFDDHHHFGATTSTSLPFGDRVDLGYSLF